MQIPKIKLIPIAETEKAKAAIGYQWNIGKDGVRVCKQGDFPNQRKHSLRVPLDVKICQRLPVSRQVRWREFLTENHSHILQPIFLLGSQKIISILNQ